MEFPRAFLRHLPLACALLWQSSPLALADNATAHSALAGEYQSSMQAGPFISLSLGKDRSATVTEDSGNGATTLFGHWVDSGGQVVVTFDAAEGEQLEPPMAFQSTRDGLRAVTWNHTSWGKVDPPPMKRGFKVKHLYWLTTNP
jgi:hypothetical protein